MGKFTTIGLRFTTLNFFLVVFALLFICFLFFVANYSILSSDDFYTAYLVKENSLQMLLHNLYISWNFRFLAVIVNYLLCLFVNNNYGLTLFHAISFFLLFLSSFYILKKILSLNTSSLLVFSLLGSSLFYFSSAKINEAVFWMAGATSYLYSIPLLLIGLFLVLFNKNSLLNIILAFMLFFGAGGFSEVYAISFIILLLFLLFYKISLRQNKLLLITAILGTATAFFINYSAPGNSVRISLLPEPTITKAIVIGTKTIIKIVSINTAFNQLIALLIGIFLFKKISETSKFILKNKKEFVLFLIGLAVIPIYTASYILSDTPPERLLIISELSFIVLFSFYLSKIKINANYLLASASALLILFFIFNYKHTINYYASIQQQLIVLKKLNTKSFSNVYGWQNKTNTGLIYPTVLSNDSNYFTNVHVKKFLQLNFSIIAVN